MRRWTLRTFAFRSAVGLAFVAGAALVPTAMAGGVNWSISLGAPGVVVGASNGVVGYPVYSTAYPLYTTPARVVYAPAPVYVQPRPVVLPAPVYYPVPPQAAWNTWPHGHRHGHRHGHHAQPGHVGHHANWGGQQVIWAPAHNQGHSAILAPHPRWNPPAYQQWSNGEAP